jgi:hypothetical protein
LAGRKKHTIVSSFCLIELNYLSRFFKIYCQKGALFDKIGVNKEKRGVVLENFRTFEGR